MSDVKVGTPEWLAIRRTHITATDLPILMGVGKFGKTPLQLYNEKISGLQQYQNPAMKRGLALEEEALRACQDMNGFLGLTPKFITRDGWMAASIDGLNSMILVEIKCPGDSDHAVALRGEVPVHYYPQVQWQLAVSGLPMMTYFSYRPGDVEPCATVIVRRDEEYIKKMVAVARSFWEDLINFRAPAPTSKDVEDRSKDMEFTHDETLLASLLQEQKQIKEEIEVVRDRLILRCKGRNSKGKTLKFTLVTTKGSVDYTTIPQLRNVDLDLYRKPSRQDWRVENLHDDDVE